MYLLILQEQTKMDCNQQHDNSDQNDKQERKECVNLVQRHLEPWSDKKEIQEPGLETEKAKDLELDEKSKPTRKVSHPATPISNKEEPSTHDKRKGRRTIK